MKTLFYISILSCLGLTVSAQTISANDIDNLAKKWKDKIEGAIELARHRCLKLSCWYPDNGEFGGHLEKFFFETKNDTVRVSHIIYKASDSEYWSSDILSSDKYDLNDSILIPLNKLVKSLFFNTLEEKRLFSNAMYDYTAKLSTRDGDFLFDGFQIETSTLSKLNEFENLKKVLRKYKLE